MGFLEVNLFLKTGQPHFLEVNTIPGLTKESILPQQAAQAGNFDARFV